MPIRHLTGLIALCFFTMSAQSKEVWITTGADALISLHKHGVEVDPQFEINQGVALLKVNEDDILNVSHTMHHDHKRCGGFFFHDTKEEALQTLNNRELETMATEAALVDLSITNQARVSNWILNLQEMRIRKMIQKLSSFNNRYYKADTGVESQDYLKSEWEKIISARSDAKVEYFKHNGWPQPSVILTIEGSENPDEIVVIGGHADSIAGFFSGARARAPGADDNASGIATMTETIRVLVENNYRPKKTIMAMAYAAEEVGLRGSKEIAQKFKSDGKNVIGKLQLDMTNFKGEEMNLFLISDYTNKKQNEFLGSLIDEYLKESWGWTKCGYACSDHASWTQNGFSASMPSEASFANINKKIHTRNDTIDISGGTATHALRFSQLALSYLVEMAK